ncbi:DUF1801 domain-containing protein [Thalassospira lucentensis]|uniref:DUF1801 domain-containing protein n=1 Tax=Thalassospira lucentensis TaxID=168935 RepID=UPI00399D5881
MVMPRDFATTDVAAKFAAYPDKPRQMLLTIRRWIFEIAGDEASVGTLDESLKWGEPAWRPKSGSGITIRADWKEKSPGQVMVFFDCKTDLIDRTRSLLSADLTCEGNRAIILPISTPLPEAALKTALGWALTYHRDRKAQAS